MWFIYGGFECYMQKDMVSAYKFEFYMQKTMLTFGQMMLRVPRKRSCARKKRTQMKKSNSKELDFLAAVLGFEPRHTESESAVLPLHNTAIFSVPEYCITLVQGCQVFFYK